MICLVDRSGKLHLSVRSFICFLDCFRKSYIESGHSKSSLWNTHTMIVVQSCSAYLAYFQRCTAHAGGEGTYGRFHGAYLILVPQPTCLTSSWTTALFIFRRHHSSIWGRDEREMGQWWKIRDRSFLYSTRLPVTFEQVITSTQQCFQAFFSSSGRLVLLLRRLCVQWRCHIYNIDLLIVSLLPCPLSFVSGGAEILDCSEPLDL